MKTPILAFVGRSNTGKTTLIERLIPVLADRGIKVATIKHHHLPLKTEQGDKDTDRHKRAGAKASMIVSEGRLGLVKDLEEQLPVEELAARYLDGIDLVIVEGFKKEPIPKIEVYNHKENEPPVTLGDANLLAIVADAPVEARVRVFTRDEVEAIAEFIIEWLSAVRGG